MEIGDNEKTLDYISTISPPWRRNKSFKPPLLKTKIL